MAAEILALAGEPEALIAAATHAKQSGHPNATQDLADLVEAFGRTPVMDAIGDEARGKKTPAGALAVGSARI